MKVKILKALFIGLIFGGIISASLYPFSGIPKVSLNKTTEGLEQPYTASCKILAEHDGRTGLSTGVLLDTGFILGCAHGVDSNANLFLDDEERDVKLEFNINGEKVEHNGKVLVIGSDYCIIMPDEKMVSSVSASIKIPLMGEEVYTIGYPKGAEAHLTKGYQSSGSIKDGETERTSISIYMGNSGGGIFTEAGKTVGVVKAVGYDQLELMSNVVVLVPNGDRLQVVRGQAYATYLRILSNWCEYTSVRDIHEKLVKRKLGFTVLKEQNNDREWFYKAGIRCFLQIWIFLTFTVFLRRELFGK